MVTVKFEKEKMRAAAYDDGRLVGECDVTENDGCWVITHTGVDPDHGGQGIACDLVRCIADNARTECVKVDPVCSYAAKEFERRPEYSDVKK